MELEGARHEGMVVYTASREKLLINWSDGNSDVNVMTVGRVVSGTVVSLQPFSTVRALNISTGPHVHVT